MKIIQASKLVDGIDLNEEKSTNANEKPDSSSELENNENIDSDIDKLVRIHKAIDVNNKIELCDTCVENKHTRIVKFKRLTPIIWRLQEISADLWGPHNPLSLLGRNYIGPFLQE